VVYFVIFNHQFKYSLNGTNVKIKPHFMGWGLLFKVHTRQLIQQHFVT